MILTLSKRRKVLRAPINWMWKRRSQTQKEQTKGKSFMIITKSIKTKTKQLFSDFNS
jgi:hypothetical protein